MNVRNSSTAFNRAEKAASAEQEVSVCFSTENWRSSGLTHWSLLVTSLYILDFVQRIQV